MILMIGVSFYRLAFTVNTIAFLCVFNLWRNTQNGRTIRMQILAYFVSLFYHLNEFQKF